LEGEGESSCGHPREAMNLFLARRISRRNNRVDSKESTQFIFHQHLCLTAL
jgi:hypothetical protein